jgi:hypothetical protein
MAAQTSTALHQLLGLVIWGDIGPLTMYRSRQGRLVIFKKTWPDKPATPPQLACRDSMSLCGRAWRNMPAHQRFLWHCVSSKCQMLGHGYNLWVHWRFKQKLAFLKTAQHQAGIELAVNASTKYIYDPKWKDKPVRRGPTFKNPDIFLMPYTPSIHHATPCTVWFIPFNLDHPYWHTLDGEITIEGRGSIDTWPIHNRTPNPIIYYPDAPNTAARIGVVIDWPDGIWTEKVFFITVD